MSEEYLMTIKVKKDVFIRRYLITVYRFVFKRSTVIYYLEVLK